MRFRLRTLLIVLALGPPVLAGAWWAATTSGEVLRLLQLAFGIAIAVAWVCALFALATGLIGWRHNRPPPPNNT